MDTNQKDFNQDRHLFLFVKQIDEQDPNIVQATVSTDEIDRYGEIVRPDAIRNALPAFVQNPVVLPAHQHRLENGEPPVIGIVLTNTIIIAEHSIDMNIKFDTDELGQKYAHKYQKKIMRAFSIGFRGIKGEFKELQLTGKQTSEKIWIWIEIELLEISAVAVPANRGALARAKGFYDHEENIDGLHSEISILKSEILNLKSFIETSLDDIKSLFVPDSDGFAEALLSGEAPVESIPCKDESKAGQSLSRIQKAFQI